MNNNEQLLKDCLEIFRKTDAIYYNLLKKYKLSINAYDVLIELYLNKEGIEPMRVADTLCFARQLMTSILNNLESKGYIDRISSKDDRRRKKIILTPKGQVFANEVYEDINSISLRAIERFDNEKKHQMYQNIKDFYEAILEESKRGSIK